MKRINIEYSTVLMKDSQTGLPVAEAHRIGRAKYVIEWLVGPESGKEVVADNLTQAHILATDYLPQCRDELDKVVPPKAFPKAQRGSKTIH